MRNGRVFTAEHYKRVFMDEYYFHRSRSEAKIAGIWFGRCQLALTWLPRQVSRARLKELKRWRLIYCICSLFLCTEMWYYTKYEKTFASMMLRGIAPVHKSRSDARSEDSQAAAVG